MTQKEIVLSIVQNHPSGIRTEQVKIKAMYQGCSCADRFLRYLASEQKIRAEKFGGDATKTWFPLPVFKSESNGQLIFV